MTIADDLLAALSEIQAAGPPEVDKGSPASTRGAWDGRGRAGRRQKSYTRVESLPWDAFPNDEQGWAAWRAEVARQQMFKDAACGAPSVVQWPDSDEMEDVQAADRQRTFTWLRVLDGEGVEWKDVPPYEVDDLPQPVQVLETEERPVIRPKKLRLAPIEQLGEATLEKKGGRPSVMTDEQVEEAFRLIDSGVVVNQVASKHWREWGFASQASCGHSLRRQRKLREQEQPQGWTPSKDHPWRKWKGDGPERAREEQIAA